MKKSPTATPAETPPPHIKRAEEQFALLWAGFRADMLDRSITCPPEALGAFEVIARTFYFQGRTHEVAACHEMLALARSVAGRAS